MEVARINAAGGVNGRQLELVIEDDGTDTGKATAAASKLIEQENVVAIIGATGTGQTMAMKGEIDRAGIPQLSLAGGNAVTEQIDKHALPDAVAEPARRAVRAQAACRRQGVKKVALLTDASGYGKDGLAVIKPELPKFGMTAVANETFNPGDTDMTAQLTKIKAAAPDAVLLWAAGKEAATIMKNRAQLGMTTPFFGGSGQARMEFVQGAGRGRGRLRVRHREGAAARVVRRRAEPQARRGLRRPLHAEVRQGARTSSPAHAYDGIHIIVEALEAHAGRG